jgi:hypothetical protein
MNDEIMTRLRIAMAWRRNPKIERHENASFVIPSGVACQAVALCEGLEESLFIKL